MRILWLEGAEPCNQNARNRCIYIHGTPQERSIGKAISYGASGCALAMFYKFFISCPWVRPS
jgi:hypothetical protein